MALIDVLVAGTVLIIILVPATQILITSGKVVGNDKAQAVAGSLVTAQITQDRSGWTSTTSPPTLTHSTCGSGYTTSPNVTYNLYLTACTTVNGMKYWIFQNGGWCVPNSSSTLSSGTGTLMYWVEVMVAWGGSAPPSPSTVVSKQNDVVMSSALLTPNGYSGSTSASCPL